jgi:hypothetical protein
VRLHIGELAAEQFGDALNRQPLGDVGNPSAYLLVSTEPCASKTARETMFSDAISSISSHWRDSSSPIASAISGSVSRKGAVNNALSRGTDLGLDVADIDALLHALLAPQRPRRRVKIRERDCFRK